MDNNKFWVGTSWKMNKTLAEATDFAKTLLDAVQYQSIQRFVIPPFTAVREVKQILQSSDVLVGAQNMHWADDGAWTGEISPKMLTDCNLDIIELGHSERREHFSETDETVSLKVEAAVRNGLTPLICIGETLADKQSGRATEILSQQLEGALSKLTEEQKQRPLLIAYEPVWAIGDGGRPATPEYANDRQSEIIATSEVLIGRKLPCLYGGSVNSDNCAELTACPHINGLFIGRSAWNVKGYLNILNICADNL